MNILLIGSGGREHAIAWALQKSPNTDVLYVAPGNGGTAEIAENVDLDIADGEALLSFVHERNIGLVVIGPEAPLVDGVADLLRADGVPVFGPNADGAQLEGSKAYSKAFMEANGIPTAAYGRFDNEADALAYVRRNLNLFDEQMRERFAGVGYIKPQGTYITWLDFGPLGIDDPATYFLEKAQVALTDGRLCGEAGAGCVRVNVAMPYPLLVDCLDRMYGALHADGLL